MEAGWALGLCTPFNFSWRFCLYGRDGLSPFECGKAKLASF